MKYSLVLLAILATSAKVDGQNSFDFCDSETACVVKGVKGNCSVRGPDRKSLRRVTAKARILSGEDLQCGAGSRMVILFCGSWAEKEVKSNRPWYHITKASVPDWRREFSRPGRGGLSKTLPLPNTDFFKPLDPRTSLERILSQQSSLGLFGSPSM